MKLWQLYILMAMTLIAPHTSPKSARQMSLFAVTIAIADGVYNLVKGTLF